MLHWYFFCFLDVIIQRNTKGYGADFNRGWSDYKEGFGNVQSKTFWIGLDTIHDLTKTGAYSLEVILKKNGNTKTVRWNSFMVDSESNKYRLSVSGYSGTSELSDELNYSNGMYFSTRDRDNDQTGNNCASSNNGSGWWFKGGPCAYCILNSAKSSGIYYYGGSWYEESTMILKRWINHLLLTYQFSSLYVDIINLLAQN